MRRLAAALSLALCACAALDPRAARLADVDVVVADNLIAARAPASEQQAALARAQQSFMADPRPLNRLRVAMLLAVLSPPLRDEARAAELLEPIADAGTPGVGRVAALLAVQIAERQRLARELERLTRESERIARERERQDKERDRREEALRQQVEALRAIERGIQEREEKLRRSGR